MLREGARTLLIAGALSLAGYGAFRVLDGYQRMVHPEIAAREQMVQPYAREQAVFWAKAHDVVAQRDRTAAESVRNAGKTLQVEGKQ